MASPHWKEYPVLQKVSQWCRDKKRCWFWRFPEGLGGLRDSHQQICPSSKRTELPIRNKRTPNLMWGWGLSWFGQGAILLIIKTPFSCNPVTHSRFCRKITRQTWFTSQQRIFLFQVKAFLLLITEHLSGRNRWVAISLREGGENTPRFTQSF